MRERILAFVHTLRAAGVRVSVTETLDAVRAVAVAGVERDVLREALATTVVKDEGDRPTFSVYELKRATSSSSSPGSPR